jgi:purine-nucleoside phosphorylase
MPLRLRPTAPIAADAILVGDPGRALLLAQELLAEPKMSNHARGLWGYFGHTGTGHPLTIQATGMGGPSAALVLGDLAELGVRRAVRVGTCLAGDNTYAPGDLAVVAEAVAAGASATALGVAKGEAVAPDPGLTERVRDVLGEEGRLVAVASVDAYPAAGEQAGGIAVDMQTAPLLASGRSLGVAVAAILIVTEGIEREPLGKDALAAAEKRAGRVAAAVLSA